MVKTFLLLIAAHATTAPTLSVRVDGAGMLRFARDGRAVYAKTAKLHVSQGVVCGPEDAPLLPQIAAPDGARLAIDLQGNVSLVAPTNRTCLGRLVLALFPDEQGLTPEGPYFASRNRPTLSSPGDDTAGVIRDDAPTTARLAPNKPQVIVAHLASTSTTPNPAQNLPGKVAHIVVRPSSDVEGQTFTLGEVAEIPAGGDDFGKVVMGVSPPLGSERGLDLMSVRAGLLRAGFKENQFDIECPAIAHIHRKAQEIDPTAFVDAVRKYASDHGVTTPLEADHQEAPFNCPVGATELRVDSFSQTNQAISALVSVWVNGERYNARSVRLRPDAGAIGVKNNAVVKILMRSAGATVEVSGKTKSAAWVGQTVTVVTDTGSKHQGVVIDSNTVEVKL